MVGRHPCVVTAAVLVTVLAAGCGVTPGRATNRIAARATTPPTTTALKSTSALSSTPSVGASTKPMAQYGTLLQLRMVTAEDGWAITNLALLRTTDGGLRWTVVQDGARYYYWYFLDAQNAWVVDASSVLRTNDGGKTWSKTALPGVPYQDVGLMSSGFIDFADAQHGWLVRDLGAVMGQEAVDIFATTDGGATWTLVDHTAQTGSSAGSLPLFGVKVGITFSTAKTGWAVLQLPTSGAIPLYQTADGGKTWAQATLPAPKSVSLSNAQINPLAPPTFFGQQDGVFAATLVDFSAGGKDVTVVWRTQDGGSSWVPVSTPATSAPMSLSFANAQTWFLLGTTGSLLVTTDAGANWKTIDITKPPTGGIGKYNVQFVSSSVGVAWKDPSHLWTTTDGGVKWVLIVPTAVAPPTPTSSRGGTVSSQDCTALSTAEEIYAETYDSYLGSAGSPAPTSLVSTPIQWCSNTSSWGAADKALYAEVHVAYAAVISHHLVGAQLVFGMPGFTWLCGHPQNQTETGAAAYVWDKAWGAPPKDSGSCGVRVGG